MKIKDFKTLKELKDQFEDKQHSMPKIIEMTKDQYEIYLSFLKEQMQELCRERGFVVYRGIKINDPTSIQ